MNLTPEQRSYLFVQTCAGAAVINALLNGLIGWAITRGLDTFPVWQTPGVVFDLSATAFGVTFGTCLGVSIQARRDLSRGKITLPTPPPFSSLVSRFPKQLLSRSIVLGAVSVPMFLPPAAAVLAALGAQELSVTSFVSLKAGFAALQGAVVTPFLLIAALSDELLKGRVRAENSRV